MTRYDIQSKTYFFADDTTSPLPVEAATTHVLARCYILTLIYNLKLRGTNTVGTSQEKPPETHRMGPTSHASPMETFGAIGASSFFVFSMIPLLISVRHAFVEVHRTAHVYIDERSVADEVDQKKAVYMAKSCDRFQAK